MNKMLVAVFDNENKAFEGLSALKELHSEGEITLYATGVVSKDQRGKAHLQTESDQGPIGTTTGLVTGSLIGWVGGPVGLAVGALTGSIAGLIFDVSADDINVTFADEVSEALTPGKTAVIAEIDELWTVPVDSKLEVLGAVIFRRLRDEVAEEQLARESRAIAAEYRNLKEEMKEAGEEEKAAIRSAIAKLQTKARAANQLLKRKISEAKEELDAKVSKMEWQMIDAKQRRKAKIEKRISEVKEEYKMRTDRLKQASKLIGEAVGPKEELQLG